MSWSRQSKDKPLFPDLLWSRPENKRYAGKLLIVGGNASSLGMPAKAYSSASKAGIGSSRVLLPDSTRKVLGKSFIEAEFLPSTISGSFAVKGLSELIDAALWADGVLLAGDFGRNSETAILLEKFIQKYSGQLTVVDDTLEYFLSKDNLLVQRDDTTLITEMSQLQRLTKSNQPHQPILHSMDVVPLTEALNNWTANAPIHIATSHQGQIIVSSVGKASITAGEGSISMSEIAAFTSVWWLQHPQKPFEALSTAAYVTCAERDN